MFDRVLIFLMGMLLLLGSGAAQQSSTADTPGANESSGTLLKVQMQERVSSADARNGQTLRGQLTEAVTLEGRAFAVGAPVTVTVVAVAKAGEINSAGELSLQVEAVGQEEVLSDVIVILGKEGTRELGDSAPAKGTEAVVEAKSVLTFHVVPLGLANRERRLGQEKRLEAAGAVGAGLLSVE
ncbi:hypothetical protein FTW19_04965 [Terriglobus albidus]|uniref:Uncharacterized protein n=1 Tax=Terriglobus albidus TaxID=1592106 RepID=A0A5B9E5Y8_9BACT|nr:hypothetical protein [Terriglobus albidus]QEE27418.1 hypothetical protein FTW19_04965 [Terriglobus albidus]